MEELDLRQLFNMFWSRKVPIILIVLIFISIGIIYTIGFTAPKYTSYTTLVLASSNNNTNTITSTDISVNSKLVATYSELIKTKNVIRKVVSNLGINISEEEIRNNIAVTSVSNTELIKISVTNSNANTAAKVANEVARVFGEKVKEIYNINNVQIVDEAEVSSVASNINHKKDIIMFASIGIVIAIIYVVVANMLDTTIKTAEDVEEAFKVPVLASIPLYENDVQKIKNRGKGRGGKR